MSIPPIFDITLLLAVALPSIAFLRGWHAWCGLVFLTSFAMVTGYDRVIGGSSVRDMYIAADMVSLGLMLASLFRMDWIAPKSVIIVTLGYALCCAIHGLRLAGLVDVGLFYWNVLRVINAAQLIAMGISGGLSGGKFYRGRRPVHFLGVHRFQALYSVFRSAPK